MAPLLVTLMLVGGGPAAATRFRNIDNTPFATRTNGPQGAVLIDEGATSPLTPLRAGEGNEIGLSAIATQSVAAQHSVYSLQRAEHTMHLLQHLGLKSPDAQVRFPRTVYHLQNGQLVLPDLVRLQQAGGQIGDPTNQITFQFSGFPDTDKQALQAYLQSAVPKARLIYGPPAFDITVTVVQDDTLQTIQGGFYDTAANEIHIPPLSGNFPEDTFVLIMLVLNAFHDDIAFFYDAWEQGFTGAAATVVQTTPGVSPAYNPVDPGPFYCLSVYECENQPALGNNTFYPDSGFAGMLVWRIAMVRAVWFKCYIEDPQFFANFNQLYYQSYFDGLPGDIPGLKDIAAQVLPTVEGMTFYEWYQRQYVLDTSIHTGSKLYTWNIPLEQSVALIAEHYITDANGNEAPRGGQARTIYWNYDFTLSLYAEEGNIIDIAASGDGAGEGYLIPTFFNIGGPQLVTVQADLNGLRSMYPYPYGVRGFDPGENDFYGGLMGGPVGSISVTGGATDDIDANRAVWGVSLTGGRLSPTQLQVTVTNPQSQTNTRTVNVGWDSYVMFIDGGGQAQVQHTFPAGVSLMSLPVQPTNPSAAEVLGVAPQDFLLARWDPALPPNGVYHIWPDIEPFAPGRGFWVRLFGERQISIDGILPPQDKNFEVPLELGWNMIGGPRRYSVDLADLQVQVGTDDAINFSDAFSQGYLQPGVFGYSEATGYELVDTLVPFAGYWLRCLTPGGARLIFPAQTGSSTYNYHPRKEPLVDDPDATWQMSLYASAAGRQGKAYLGVAPQAHAGVDAQLDLQAPPSFGPCVQPRFIIGSNKAPYLSDIRPEGGSHLVWTVQVSSNLVDSPVYLSWPDMSQVPQDLQPVLVDPAARRRIYMRTSPAYEIPGGPEGVQRMVQIEMLRCPSQQLTLSSLVPLSNSAGVEMTYSLSASAAVTANIMNIGGRTVRRILANNMQPAGQNRLVWNLRNETGRRVPDGLYLIKLVARRPDGQQVTALRSVNVFALRR